MNKERRFLAITGHILFALFIALIVGLAVTHRKILQPPKVTLFSGSKPKEQKLSKKVAITPKKEIQNNKAEPAFQRSPKALLTAEEQAAKEKLLSDHNVLHSIENSLLKIVPREQLADRYSKIDFLEQALLWKDNPAREEVVSIMERLIEVKNLEGVPSSERKILIGDKIELFTILTEEVPEKAHAILARAKDSQVHHILDYAGRKFPQKKVGQE